MSQETLVTEELIARQLPEAQVIIRLLLAKIAELEARLNKTPRNSSLPPSTEHPHAKPAPQKEKSGKRPGGQPGHLKHQRPLIPVEQCTGVVSMVPETCRRCGESLAGSDAEPLRHQVWEIPEIQPLVTEYQLHRLTCPRCSISTCAELPAGVPQSQAGPRLVALAGLIIDHSNLQEPMQDWFPGDDLFTPGERRRGIPIGNQTSQFFANVYLNPLDHFVKEQLGIEGYVRYVDDFLLFSNNKRVLAQAREAACGL